MNERTATELSTTYERKYDMYQFTLRLDNPYIFITVRLMSIIR